MKLRPYQHQAVDSIFEYFQNHGGTDHVTGFPIRANPIVAMPCATGKSIVIAEFFKRAFQLHPQTRGIMATHIKKLIKQNRSKILEMWPQCPIGIYSAGLKKKDNFQPIIYGGIRSMVGKWPIFGYRDFIVIDEVHMVSPDAEASYIKFIWELLYGPYVEFGKMPTKEQFQKAMDDPNCNPYLKIIGLSATPYRMGLGRLTNGPIFTHFAINMCTREWYGRFLAEGYLAWLVPKRPRTELNTDGLKITNGDYNQGEMQARFDKKDINIRCLQELVEYGQDRKCGLIFASGIEHAEHLTDLMNNYFGQECTLIHSGNKDYPRTGDENDKAMELWETLKVKWMVNVDSVTTGVDNPYIDIMGILRATQSTPLHVQIDGRGARPVYAKGYDLEVMSQRLQALKEMKPDCIILDFVGNTRRLGPIDDPVIPRMKGAGPPGEAPVKLCKKCSGYNHISATECFFCGEPFPIREKLVSTASAVNIIGGEMPIVETFNVLRVVYKEYEQKVTGRSMLKVAYHCDRLKTFFESVTLEVKSPGAKMDYPVKLGRDWFRQRHHIEPPLLNETVLLMADQLRVPVRVNVWINKPGTTLGHVLGVEF